MTSSTVSPERFVLVRPGGRLGAIVLVGVFWVVGGLLLVDDFVGGHDPVPLWFVVPWLGLSLVGGYALLFRRAAELHIDGDEIVAIYAFRTRRVAVSSLDRIRPTRGGGTFVVIEVRGERPIVVPAEAGVARFADALRAISPTLPINVGWWVDVQRPRRSRRRGE